MGSLRGNYYTLDYFCKSFHNFSLIFSYELERNIEYVKFHRTRLQRLIKNYQRKEILLLPFPLSK